MTRSAIREGHGAERRVFTELSIQTEAPAYYRPMFASVFVLNTCFAIDAFHLAKRGAAAPA